MRAMNDREAIGWGAVGRRLRGQRATSVLCAAGLAGLVACGGGAKQADSPGNCPDGTVLKGSDCVPPGTESHASDDSPPPSGDSASSGSTASTASASDSPPPSGGGGTSGKIPYDKDSVEIELKRASRQVKANCGSATDENGTATGPWGKTTASVTLGRNGHVKDVTVPAPYDGQPAGVCAINAFKKIQFPPYASSSDVVVPWDIEFVKPKH
jgi:hypothetical protein